MKRSERNALAEAIFQAADEKHFGVRRAIAAVPGDEMSDEMATELAGQYIVEASEAQGMIRAARIVQRWPVED